MKADVWSFMRQCTTCLQEKLDRAKYPGLLQPLPVSSNSWEIISMDFIEGLPVSRSANAILVVVDKFSKFSHFIALRHPFTAQTVAQLFLDNVFRLHGLPKSIISDRDKIFHKCLLEILVPGSGYYSLPQFFLPSSDERTNTTGKLVPRNLPPLFCSFLPISMASLVDSC